MQNRLVLRPFYATQDLALLGGGAPASLKDSQRGVGVYREDGVVEPLGHASRRRDLDTAVMQITQCTHRCVEVQLLGRQLREDCVYVRLAADGMESERAIHTQRGMDTCLPSAKRSHEGFPVSCRRLWLCMN